MVGAGGTGQKRVRLLAEALWMAVIRHLPRDGAHERQHHKAPGVDARHKNERRDRHDRAPGKDAAGHAAFVFHKELLERTVEHDADHIAEIVEHREQQHLRHAEDALVVERREDEIRNGPDNRHARGAEIELFELRAQEKVVDHGLHAIERAGELLETASRHARARRELQSERCRQDHPENIDRREERMARGKVQRGAVFEVARDRDEHHAQAEEKAQQITAEHIDRFVHGTCLCKAS